MIGRTVENGRLIGQHRPEWIVMGKLVLKRLWIDKYKQNNDTNSATAAAEVLSPELYSKFSSFSYRYQSNRPVISDKYNYYLSQDISTNLQDPLE